MSSGFDFVKVWPGQGGNFLDGYVLTTNRVRTARKALASLMRLGESSDGILTEDCAWEAPLDDWVG